MSIRDLITAKSLVALLLAALLVPMLAACGKREWPQPKLSEDRFRIRSLSVRRARGCLIVDCELAGAWQNLESVRLLIEPLGDGPGDGCATCPFLPRATRLYSLSAPEVRQDMNRIVITACDLDPAKPYRLQLVAVNAFPALKPVLSELVLAAPQ